jgi:hypothetical protein
MKHRRCEKENKQNCKDKIEGTKWDNKAIKALYTLAMIPTNVMT